MSIDIIVVLVYFAFLIVLGFIFKDASSSTKDYFAGGGKMLWWMVGATAFMATVSAMTFTGAMGKSLTGGFSVAIVFFANATGFLCNYLFFAAKARQMRIVSPMQGIRMRFGALNEQIFTWANVPLSVLQAGIWLNALSVFVSAVTGVTMEYTVIATGLVVMIMSLMGGSWAVIASDFMQMVILIVVSLIAAGVALFKAGGIDPLIHTAFPTNALIGNGYSYTTLFIGWFICIFIKQFFSTNNMLDSYRFIASKDTNHARKAALLSFILSILGGLIWFLPAFYVAGHYPDTTTWGLDALGKKVADATYYIFVKREMPVGMVGLILSAMFAATMSSMDSALNRNAGIIVKSVYEPHFAKEVNEARSMFVSKIMTVAFGVLIICVAVLFSRLKEYGLFDAMMLVGTLIGFPILIPSLLCFFIRKTPDWAGWGTILVGLCVSTCLKFYVTPDAIQSIFNLEKPLSAREFSELTSVTMGLIAHLSITLPFFLLTQLFYKAPTGERAKEIEAFFTNTNTPIYTEETELSVTMDNRQHVLLGRMLLAAAVAVLLLVFIPNPLWGRMLFVLTSAIIAGIGLLLVTKVRVFQPNK